MKETDEIIKGMLRESPQGLSEDSIMAIACLQNEINAGEAAIRLMKKGELFAKYIGDGNKPLISDDFIIMTKEEWEKAQKNDEDMRK